MAMFRCALLFGILAAFLSGFVGAASAVLDLTPSNFDAVVLASKPVLVEFFAPWCGHCKTLAPTYEELAQNYAFASDKVSIAKVDADDNKSLGRRFGVQGFPTLKWFDGKSDKPEDYKGGRDLESLTKFIAKKIGVQPKAQKAPPSSVRVLSDASFKTAVGAEQHVLVAFTAPWCGHCKSLAPTWELLAEDFASEPSVMVAKVDAEADNSKSTAKAQGVTSYPTIKFFPKGSAAAESYSGGRSPSDLVEFLNEKAGTGRMVGGGLDTRAGTIAALDALLVNGPVTVGEMTKAAQDLKDKYSDYYIKVARKFEQSGSYAASELKRLEGMLKKGGLAPLKRDDLTSRSNILRKFLGPTQEKDEL